MEQKLTELEWGNDAFRLVIGWDAKTPAHLTRISTPSTTLCFDDNIPFVEIMAAGHGHWESSGRLIHTTLGASLRFVSSHQWHEQDSLFLAITQRSERDGIEAVLTLELPDGCAMIRSTVEIRNTGTTSVSLESVTSWATLLGSPESMSADLRKWRVMQCRQEWLSEGRWQTLDLADLLPVISQEMTGHDPRGQHALASTGTWSTSSWLPMAVFESEHFGAAWFMQVEHNGAWCWETGDCTRDAYMAASGPTLNDHAWCVELAPGASFMSVPTSVSVAGSFDELISQVIAYRRAMNIAGGRAKEPQVIFNDYMNTIDGDPTTEKLLPLVVEAAASGCEVFCIDCGWYDDSGDWWPSVGEWKPSVTRFPNGLQEVTNAIRSKGMIPGLWLEPEVIGVDSPVAHKLPDDAFFCRDGHRIVEQDRYILDFSNKVAVDYIDGVVDRLIHDFSIGYFKFDYNVSPGAGTDVGGVSVGEGMLRHLRAYDRWIEHLYERYPNLILENCSSGGMREDFAQTSRFQVQSTSDQQDWHLYPAIAAAAPMAVLPEQAANWAYPQADMDEEVSAFTLATTMLGRFFLSGYLNHMDAGQQALCAQAVHAYKTYVRPHVASSTPFWPVGLPNWTDQLIALGLKHADTSLVTVWARDTNQMEQVDLSLTHLRGHDVQVSTIFPTQSSFAPWQTVWNKEAGILTLHVPSCRAGARVFRIVQHG